MEKGYASAAARGRRMQTHPMEAKRTEPEGPQAQRSEPVGYLTEPNTPIGRMSAMVAIISEMEMAVKTKEAGRSAAREKAGVGPSLGSWTNRSIPTGPYRRM